MDKNYYMNETIGDSGIADTRNPHFISSSPISYNPFRVTPRQRNVGQYFDTDSQYDETLGDTQELIQSDLTPDDFRANQQSNWARMANALVNNVVIAGTTAISGTLGLVDGVFEALASAAQGEGWDKSVSKLWDNNVNRAMVAAQDAMREAMPIYRGKEYNDSSIWNKLGSGIFWADLIQNLGFTEGMLIPGMGMGSLMAKVPSAMARQVVPAMVSAVGEGSIEAINERNESTAAKTNIATQEYRKKFSEATSDLERSLLAQELQQTLVDIDEDETRAGNFVLASNIALLTLTNTIEFGRVFERGFGTGRRVGGSFVRFTEEGAEAMSKKEVIARGVGNRLLGAFSEGFEEVAQGVITEVPHQYTDYNSFNNSQFNPDKRELASGMISAFGEAIANRMQDSQTAEEFAMGFITGALGVPTLARNSEGKLRPVIQNNAIWETIQEVRERDRQAGIADQINERLQNDGKFKSYYNGLVRKLAIQDEKNKALDNDDAYAFNNAESADLINDFLMFSEVGHLDKLRSLVSDTVDLSDEGIDAIIAETSKNGEGPFMSQGNPMSREEVRGSIKKKQQTLLDKIDFLDRTNRAIQATYPQLNEDARKNLLFLEGQINDHTSRYDQLTSELQELLRGYVSEYIGSPHLLTEEERSELESIANSSKREFLPNLAKKPDLFERALLDPSFSMPLVERANMLKKLEDSGKLAKNLNKMVEAAREIIENPQKSERDRKATEDKAVRDKEKRDKSRQRERINNSTVSDLTAAAREDDELLSMLDEDIDPNELDEAVEANRKKKQEVKNIIATTDALVGNGNQPSIIDTVEGDEQAKKDAKRLVRHSESKSESQDELLDLTSEAFNDPMVLFEGDSSMQELADQGMSREELLDIAQQRLDAANEILSRAIPTFKEAEKELADLPKEGIRRRSLGDNSSQDDDSGVGHDSTSKGTTAKTEKQDEDKAEEPEEEAPKQETPQVSNEKAQEQISRQANQQRGATPSDYWRPNTTRLPFGYTVRAAFTQLRGKKVTFPTGEEFTFPSDYREFALVPFYKMARFLTTNEGNPKYTEEQLKRFEAVYKYLEKVGAFDRVDTGKVKPKNKVRLVVSKELNDDAGTLVVLLADEYDNIIGDLPHISESRHDDLTTVLQQVEEEYKKAGEPDYFVSSLESSVSKMMVGKLPYTAEETMNPLNEIVGTRDSNGQLQLGTPLIGIAVSAGSNSPILIEPGRTRNQGQSQREMVTISPIEAEAGQPFLLLETSNPLRRYLPVPFIMENYSPTSNSKMAQAVNTLIESITPESNLKAISAELSELIGGAAITMEIKNGQISIGIKRTSEGKWENLYRGPVTDNLSDVIKKTFTNAPYQISRKYMNGTYKGQSYNQMIGELARTNLPVATGHTLSDWFIINPIVGGKEKKGKGPKSTGNNPNHRAKSITITYPNGYTYHVNTETFEVTDHHGETFASNDSRFDLLRAYAYGISTNKNMAEPYETPWGWYDANKGQFVTKPTPKSEVESVADEIDEDELASMFEGDELPSKEELEAEKRRQATAKKHKQTPSEGDTVGGSPVALEYFLNGPAGVIENSGYFLHAVAAAFPAVTEELERYRNSLIDDLLGIDPEKFTKENQDLYKEIAKIVKDAYGKPGVSILAKMWDNPTGLFKRDGDLLAKEIDSLKPIVEEKGGEKPSTSKSSEMTEEEANKTMKSARLLSSTNNKLAWESLSAEEKIAIASLKGPKRSQIWKNLVREGFDPNEKAITKKKLRMDVLSYINSKGQNREISLTDEEIAIKNRAISNGTFMRAPNGNPTNLTERQWLQVRTKAFKDWFGDWENNPSEASKVVDENGEPLVVYHGNRTDNRITKFDINKKGSEHKERAISGFWFTTDIDIAKIEYALKPESIGRGSEYLEYGEVIPVFLNIKNPIVSEQKGIKVKDTPYGTFTTSEESIDDFINRSKSFETENTDGYILTMIDSDNRADDFVSKQTQLVVFNPNQIKSAVSNTGEFSTTNDDIRYREHREQTISRITKREKTWFNKHLPQLSNEERLRFVDRIIGINEEGNAVEAWGQFKNGIIYLASNAARGTLYHEAFHSVVHTLLSQEEYNKLYDAAKEHYGKNRSILSIEEDMAEDFRRYMQFRETPIVGTIARFFDKIKHFIKSLFGKESAIDNLFYRISSGDLSNIQPRDSSETRLRSNLSWEQREARNIFFDEVNGRHLTDSDIVRINRRLQQLSDRLGDVPWHLRPTSKGGYYVAGYNNKAVTFDDYFSPALSGRFRIARELAQYSRDKLEYANLSQEQMQYLSERGVTQEEYSSWPDSFKETIFRCM